MTGFWLLVSLAALIGAIVAAILVPRLSLWRAALVVPSSVVLIAVPTGIYFDHQSSWDGGWGKLAAIVILTIGGASAAASFISGLMAAVVRLRYRRDQ